MQRNNWAEAVLNSAEDYYCVGEQFEGGYRRIEGICFYEVKNVSGNIAFSMPFPIRQPAGAV